MARSKVKNKTKLEHCAAFYLDDERKTNSFMHKFCSTTLQTYTLDVLCRQQIKLFQVVSTSELHEY